MDCSLDWTTKNLREKADIQRIISKMLFRIDFPLINIHQIADDLKCIIGNPKGHHQIEDKTGGSKHLSDYICKETKIFKKGNEFTIKSGNIVLTPNENGTVDVYLNFDGREQDQTKMLYKDSVSLNPAEIIIPTSISLIPTSISEKQKQLNQIISK